ncbi:MAG: TetR/AcrR family transcriptional regulator [Deltaproteobacteria bacterium]|nr:MAG: TetR/AcrR family transcriptional regulator [Deltaproteobacteria bacterium]
MTDRREAIVDALGELLPELGYDGASTGKLASRAGIRQGLVHYYFPSKAAILEALVERLAESIDARLGAWQAPEDLLAAALALGHGEDASAVALFVAILGEARHPEVHAVIERQLGDWRERLARGMDGDDAAAAGLIATILGYWQLGVRFPGVVPRGSAWPTARRMLGGLT